LIYDDLFSFEDKSFSTYERAKSFLTSNHTDTRVYIIVKRVGDFYWH
jgi:hypothetical protein